VRVDAERAQVPAKVLILCKLSKLSVWSLNFEQCCSEDNPKCTCTFDEYGYLEEANPTCPVIGHRYTLFLSFGTNNFLNRCIFSSDWGGAHYLSVSDLTASKVAGPGTRERGDFATPPYLKY
jgi:hypothetical protein